MNSDWDNVSTTRSGSRNTRALVWDTLFPFFFFTTALFTFVFVTKGERGEGVRRKVNIYE